MAAFVLVGVIGAACSRQAEGAAGDPSTGGPASAELVWLMPGALLQPGDGSTLLCLGFPEAGHPTCTQFAEVTLPDAVGEAVDWDETEVGGVVGRSADGLSLSFSYDGGDVVIKDAAARADAGAPAEPSERNPGRPDPIDAPDFAGLAPEEVNLRLHEMITQRAEETGTDLTGLFGVSVGAADGEAVITVLAETPVVTELLASALSAYRYVVAPLARSSAEG